MLEVNNFNAIRISLASPEQIRSWSHGEVTKPETINYRTLKPERDGLFCERIFGPTKDWECYCGKYKRVRYKGVICDKCGVEVARSKVRRERMGHIQLAAPVSHIWYVKGTPSRLGLLLDVSPRNLERVLYFANYMVTDVDQEAVKAMLESLGKERDEQIKLIEAEANSRIDGRKASQQSESSNLTSSAASRKTQLDAELKERLETLEAEAADVRGRVKGLLKQAAPEEIAFHNRIIARQDEMLNSDRLSELDEIIGQEREKIEHEIQTLQSDTKAMAEGEADQRSYVYQQEVEQILGKMNSDISAIREGTENKIDDLEDLLEKHLKKEYQLLTENRYRELRENYGNLFKAGMGAEAVYSIVKDMEMDSMASELRLKIQTESGQRRKKSTKRLRVVEAFRKSGNRPEWMIFTILPVIPPDLRPMVQLDGGRFATSDLNDLYRRVINRNNRLQRLKELGAPEIIIRNEKRMLQEAVDALIDNGRRGRVVSGSGKHKLKSLSDMLKGKQGRFRQNLLGKRVDYSGRSVIVVGPDLRLHQCGLPKKMALELFKPFVMRRLVEKSYAHNIKSAKRIVERVRPEVWDVLEEVIKDYLVLLNRAPTLHRLGIQAFEAVLIEGSAIQLHPLVCKAYNADFDGDQMAVHVPLSRKAQEEARDRMLSVYNLLRPSNGEPVITPTQDIILGCYYLTIERPGAAGEGKMFSSFQEALLAYETSQILAPTSVERTLHLQAPIRVLVPEYLQEAVAERQRRDNAAAAKNGQPEPYPVINPRVFTTTVGRVLFIEQLPKVLASYYITEQNSWVGSNRLGEIIAECHRLYGSAATAVVADRMKRLGFKYSTKGGISIGVSDVEIPHKKYELLEDADKKVIQIERQYKRGLLTEAERYRQTIETWEETRALVSDEVKNSLNPFGSLAMMTTSGAKGNIKQISQMSGMRGLMADPSGRVIELPIRSNFREGLTVQEYFISTHGARKGLADTAIRTADSGYLTRRLVDVAQDVIIFTEDCETEQGIPLKEMDASEGGRVTESFERRILGRIAAAPISDPATGEIICDRNEELDEVRSKAIAAAGIKEVYVRSPLSCMAQFGVCRYCYGRNLAKGKLVEIGEAVGIIAAQSIGEPGTQLTMRTFHTGGVAGADITSGLPRVEELFEARVPKAQAILSEIDGTVEILQEGDIRKLKVVSMEYYTDQYEIPDNYEVLVREGDEVSDNTALARSNVTDGDDVIAARLNGRVSMNGNQLVIRHEEREERDYDVPHAAELRVTPGQHVKAGEALTLGSSNPQEILHILGTEAVQRYLIDEVQRVYRSQGVNTNEKHMEITVRQMLRKVQIETQGDTDLLSGELVDRFAYEEINSRVLAEGGEPATAQTVLLGVTKAALKVDSFLSAASFQETTRVLTEAAIQGMTDRLHGLKENVIIGKLIPAGSGIDHRSKKKSKVPLSELLDIDPDNAEQLAHLAELEEEIDETPPQVPEILMHLPQGINTNGNLVLDGTAADLDDEVVEEEAVASDNGLEALLRAISGGAGATQSLQDAGDDDSDLDTDPAEEADSEDEDLEEV
ncbi:MAG: DNA-directed polymerase, beta subunit [Chloroflexi bacterium]|jgi:DNA-directed RNA polymerase subunit beta'|nr:DNA-directed polymerase, beta subunit [Chloroflexota bacterium]